MTRRGPGRRPLTLVVAAVVLAALGAAGWRLVRRGGAPSFRNAGFESGLDGWTAAGRAGFLRGAASAHGGDVCASLPVAAPDDASPGPDARISQDGLRVAEGRTYRFSLWVSGRGAPTLEAWIVGRGKGRRLRAAVRPAVPDRWTRVDAEWTAPRDDEVRFELVARAGEAPVPGLLLVDDLSVATVESPGALDLTGDARFDDEPSLARGADGALWVAWTSWRDGDTIRVARVEPGGGGGGLAARGEWQVDGGPGASLLGPRVVAGPGGVALVYAAEREDDWQVVAVPLTSAGPGTKVEVGNGAAVDCKPAAAFRGDDLWLAWESNAGGERQIWAASVAGGRASAPVRVGADGAPSWTPSVAATADGRVAVAWHAFLDGNTDVMLRVRGADGTWAPVRRLTHAPTIDRHPVLAADGDDLWIAWENANSLGVRIGHTVQRRVEVARIGAAGLETPAGGLAASPLGQSAECPAIAFDEAGRLRAAFLRPRRADRAWQVWTTSWDGASWSPPSPASPRKGLWRTPGVAVDGGDLVVAFQADDLCVGWPDIDRTPDARSRVYVTRVRGPAADADAPAPPPAGSSRAASGLVPLAEPENAFDAAGSRAALGDDRPRVVETDAGAAAGGRLRLLFGDLHEHSDISICGKLLDDSPDVSWQSMRDFPHLDFGAVTDHAENFDPYLWNYQAKTARLHDDPGRFVAFLGEEWTSDSRKPMEGRPYGHYGHRNLVFGDLRMPRWWNPRSGQTPEQVWEEIRATGSDFAVIPHQLADTGNVPTDWAFVDEVAQPIVEMYQHRGSYEAIDAPRRAPRGLDVRGWYVQDLLARGLVFGFIASPDHGGADGRAAVWATDLSRKGILDALRARRCYGTTGPRIVLDVRVGGRFMGTEDASAAADEAVRVTVHAECPAEIDRIEVCRDGVFRVVPFTAARAGAEGGAWVADAAWTDPSPRPARTWTYVRITQKDGEMAWSSPVWLGPRTGR